MLHISDLHFSTERPSYRGVIGPSMPRRFFSLDVVPSTYSIDLAEKAASFCLRLRDTIDLLVVSGDLADTGMEDDLRAALEFIEGPASGPEGYKTSRKRPTISGAVTQKSRILALPGNHDRYANWFGDAGGTEFENVFSYYWPGPRHPRVKVRALEKEGERLAVVAADFCLARRADAVTPHLVTQWGCGRAYDDVVRALQDESARLRSEYGLIAIVWVVHFPPTDVCKPEVRLIDHHKLSEAAATAGVEFILAGHLHQREVYTTPSGIKVYCAGALTAPGEDGNWIHLIDVEIAGGRVANISLLHFHWDDEEGSFRESA